MDWRPHYRPGEFWEPTFLRLFVSHTNTHRTFAGDLKRALRAFAIDGFVAHDDIEPNRQWEDVISVTLAECEALAVILSEDVRASAWVDQECGWAMGRGVPVISIDIGCRPYGFLGRYQALAGRERTVPEIARLVFGVLGVDERTADAMAAALIANLNGAHDDIRSKIDLLVQMMPTLSTQQLGHWADQLIVGFERSASYDDARPRFDLLMRMPKLSEIQLNRIESAHGEGSAIANQVGGVFRAAVRRYRRTVRPADS